MPAISLCFKKRSTTHWWLKSKYELLNIFFEICSIRHIAKKTTKASYLALKWLDPLVQHLGYLITGWSRPSGHIQTISADLSDVDHEVNRGYERQVNLQDSPPLADQEDTARNTSLWQQWNVAGG